MSGGVAAAAGLVEKPHAFFGFVDIDFQQAGRCHVAMLVADIMGLAHRRNEPLIVVTQLGQHILRIDVDCVVIGDALLARNIADRTQRGLPDLAHAFGQHVDGGENLISLLVKQKMVVAEMWPADMPVEILCLQIKRKGVRQQQVECSGDILGGIGAEIGRGRKAW